jgi:hypothetical protein
MIVIDEGTKQDLQWFIACAKSIAHWEAINILVALHVFSSFIKGVIWCDNRAAVSLFSSGRGVDPLLHSIARNLWLEQAVLDCELVFQHIIGADNNTADLLSTWFSDPNPTA